MTQAQDEKVGNTQEKKFIVGEHQCSWGENLPGQTLSFQAVLSCGTINSYCYIGDNDVLDQGNTE